MIVLIDCDNFFVSCERLFQPKLVGIPVVVASSNDGCVVARSNEAKALGISMGTPLFKVRELIRRHQVMICSSNFALYQDLSRRVMAILKQEGTKIELYSIDEAFLEWKTSPIKGICPGCSFLEWANQMRQKIWQWIGLPVSIGIAPTKTLAKIAGTYAKRKGSYLLAPEQLSCIKCCPTSISSTLDNFPIEEVWGIGRKRNQTLQEWGIYTANDLLKKPDGWIRSKMSVIGLKTAMELRGIRCFKLEEDRSPKQSITYSRSFGQKVENLKHLEEAIATYTARACETLRKQNDFATSIHVFLVPAKKHFLPTRSLQLSLPTPSAYTPRFIQICKEAIQTLFIPGIAYKKVGVTLSGFIPETSYPLDLFEKNLSSKKEKRLMSVIDTLNRKTGKRVIQTAGEGLIKEWQVKCEMRSCCYTTSWDELLEVVC